MKKFKKILALALSLAMVLGMSVTTFAAPGTSESEAKIEGIEAEMKDGQNTITVKAYQIISYDVKGSYEEVIEGTIDKDTEGNLAPTAANALALAKRTDELGTPVSFDEVDGTYTASVNTGLTAGTWLVLVEGSSKYFYNPILISVEQGPGGIKYGTLNLATDSWLDTDGKTTLYAKKSEPTITKTAEKANAEDTEVVGTQYGDILKFTVTADIPGYITGSTGMTYSIEDKLTGLSLVNDSTHFPTATVGGNSDETLTKAVTEAIVNGEASFNVNSLDETFLTENAGKKIEIIYFAKVTSEAKINVDKLNNTATLTYSTNDSSKTHEKEVETKHYTFGIDTTVNGTIGNTTIDKTGEFVKINADGDIVYNESEKLVVGDNKTEFLQGAEFQLHIGNPDGPVFKEATFTTDKDGRLEINGLDSDVDYYLIETKAPTGYSINTTPIKIRITAKFEDPKDTTKLTGYDVTFDEKATTHYSYNTETNVTVLNNENNASNPFGFKNTTLSSLPSTGGIGTTIFTIGGCAIMILAAALYFASRRKTAK